MAGGKGGNGRISTSISTSDATSIVVGEVSGGNLYFSGGGAGSRSGAAGLGGGRAGVGPGNNGLPGLVNSGGGGSGAAVSNSSNSGGNGGSGVIIFRVPNRARVKFSQGVTFVEILGSEFKTYVVKATSTTSETVTIR